MAKRKKRNNIILQKDNYYYHLHWYNEYGNEGKISIQHMKECINQNNLFNNFDQYYV